MGIRPEYYNFVIKNIGGVVFGKKILELGCQLLREDFKKKYKTRSTTGKEYWGSLGAWHISIDKSGLYGSMALDLEKEIDIFKGVFDIVLNFGVSNCIKNYGMCYKNMTNFLHKKGTMIHILPDIDSDWSSTHTTSRTFFDQMAIENGLKLIDIDTINGKHGKLNAVALKHANCK